MKMQTPRTIRARFQQNKCTSYKSSSKWVRVTMSLQMTFQISDRQRRRNHRKAKLGVQKQQLWFKFVTLKKILTSSNNHSYRTSKCYLWWSNLRTKIWKTEKKIAAMEVKPHHSKQLLMSPQFCKFYSHLKSQLRNLSESRLLQQKY